MYIIQGRNLFGMWQDGPEFQSLDEAIEQVEAVKDRPQAAGTLRIIQVVAKVESELKIVMSQAVGEGDTTNE